MKSDNRAPNWAKWKHLEKMKVWECIALSLNIDPDKTETLSGWMALGHIDFNESQEFKDRAFIAERHFGNLLRLVRIWEFVLFIPNEWKLPDEFPWTKQYAEEQEAKYRNTRKMDRTPNWAEWNALLTAENQELEIWMLVALSLNIEPDKVKKSASVGGYDDYSFDENGEFKGRLSKATIRFNGAASHWRVSVNDFANFAQLAQWSLPDEFPRNAPPSSQQPNKPNESNTPPESPSVDEEVASLYRLLLGMAIDAYRFNPEADKQKNGVMANLCAAIERAGLGSIKQDTARKHLLSAIEKTGWKPRKS